MNRSVREMTPLEIKARADIKAYAEIHEPEDAEQPILSGTVRAAVFQWLQELNSEAELKKVKLKPRRTAMLSGPPGCGKTTLAQHLAARRGLPLAVVNMEKLVGSRMGETGNNVARLFDAMTACKGSMVMLLDEFDAIGTTRSSDDQACAREMNAVVVSLLQYIDKHDGTVIAATNVAKRIDPALWRRFGLHLEIGLPDPDSRFAILTRYLAPYTLPESALDVLTDLTDGATPAILRQMMENVKRTLVLGPKFNIETSALNVFTSAIGSIQPHADLPQPPLWRDPETGLALIADFPWPPTIEKDARA